MFWRKSSPEALEVRIIDSARKNLRDAERWGRWWIVFFVIALSLFVVLTIAIANLIGGFIKNPPANRLELWVGLILGTLIGVSLHGVIGGMARFLRALLPDDRDRLLVRYHDALRQVLDGTAETATENEEGDGSHREGAPGPGPERQVPVRHLNESAGGGAPSQRSTIR